MGEAIQPQQGPQTKFLESPADIVIYGGAGGSGKSFALLLEPLRHIANKYFSAVIFRRTSPQITNPGGLWDESSKLYGPMKAEPKISLLSWKFTTGMTVKFAHMEHEKNKYDWQGSQIPFLGFDELCHFSESQFFYMLSRNRSTSGISGYVRATCNPEPDSFVAKLIDWWIGEDGFPIPDRSGVLRYFIRLNDELIWADTKQELEFKYPKSKPKSLTFISAKVTDNQILLEKDPQYLANLEALPYVERMRLKEGNWKVRPFAGSYFKKSYFQIIKADQLPARRTIVRYWDRAGTQKKEGNSPDFTAGVKVSRDASGVFYVEHVERFQEDASNVPKRIEAIAGQDGRNTIIGLEQEPGASGKFEAQFYVKQLVGYVTKVLTPTANKTSRAAPVSSQAEAGNFKIVEGPWNNTFLSELESFPISKNDDQVDALSGAFQILVDNVVGSFDQTYAQTQIETSNDFRPSEW